MSLGRGQCSPHPTPPTPSPERNPASMYVCTYIQRQRQREREKKRERERDLDNVMHLVIVVATILSGTSANGTCVSIISSHGPGYENHWSKGSITTRALGIYARTKKVENDSL